MRSLIVRILLAIASVAAVSLAGKLISLNATTIGFAYLLDVLIVASAWGLIEAIAASLSATFCFNLLFLPPIGTLTIADPQNWVALFAFLATSLIASRLSEVARRRTREAVERQQDLERLYTFSRQVLLWDTDESLPKQLARTLAEVFGFSAVMLYERPSNKFYRGGPADIEGIEDHMREAALRGTTYSDPDRREIITAVRLGAEPIGSLALRGTQLPDSVLQGIANLVAIGLERARAQELAAQAEAARQSEQLRTTLVDAIAHEFKTPLTSIKAATTALLSSPGAYATNGGELLKVADEEADRLRELVDEAIEVGRLDTGQMRVDREMSGLEELARQVIASMQTALEDRAVLFECQEQTPRTAVDRRLIKLALKQLLDNAIKYSPPETPVTIRLSHDAAGVHIAISDRGRGIPPDEQRRVFDKFYRSPSVINRIPGSGLGLSIVQSVARAHQGGLTVTSRPGETTFEMTLPLIEEAAHA